jgi:methylmalonyl-CoA mutase cobalamin-binding domain/chain
VDPLVALAALTDAIRSVGDGFACGDLWLPDLIAAAEAMTAGTALLEAEIARRGLQQLGLGVVVIGTVSGDIHDIGKNMVATLLRAAGFVVHDLGINITAPAFVEAVTKYDAQLLALSALLTTTAPEQQKVIELLKAAGLRERVRVIVGGGGITSAFADAIGADG